MSAWEIRRTPIRAKRLISFSSRSARTSDSSDDAESDDDAGSNALFLDLEA